MKEVLRKKVEKFSDEMLLESLEGMPLWDYKNWGDNFEKLMAEEVCKRGLFDPKEK